MNMKSILSLKSLFLLMASVFMLVACDNELWDEHYSDEVTERSELTIYEYIKASPELSTFAQALEKTGYDKLLSEDFTYTVWAPDNESLAALDLNDAAQLNRIVKNHIARFTHTTSRVTDQSLLMLNGKILDFKRLPGNVFTLQGKELKQADIAVRNGMIHLMKQHVPYVLNIWEYIAVAEGIDSLRNYINSLTRLELDYDASYVEGVLVDSVFKESNRVLTLLAELNTEDSTYTALLPTDAAWDDRLAKVFPYFKTLEIDGGELAQATNARWMMVRDLFYRGRLSQPLEKDSLESTAGTLFTNAKQLIPTAHPEQLSNGYGYIVPAYGQKPEETWLKPIRIEAETGFYGRSANLFELATYSSLGTGFDVSGNYYINATAQSTQSNARMSINFPLPNTLATKYNIYCVFVPVAITDTASTKAFKVKFSINYNYTDEAKNDSVWIGNTGFVRTHTQAKQFITDKKEITKVLVAENYEFPWSNIVSGTSLNENMFYSDKVRVGLRVENAAGSTALERLNFSRDLRIDCIILEPVE